MKTFIVAALCVVAVTLVGNIASAHVLITDETQTRGAILHIVPDDDPVAGKPATIFFDTQGGLLIEASQVTLTITASESGTNTPIETKRDGSLVTAQYTFPSQGLYQLRYDVINKNDTYTFMHMTRISRGVSKSSQESTRYIWAESLLVATGISMVILVILLVNRWQYIAKQSQF